MENKKIFTQKRIYFFIIFLWSLATFVCLMYLLNANNPFKIGDINDPRTESTVAVNLINEKFPFSKSSLIILYQSKDLTTKDQKFKSYIEKSLSNLKKLSFDVKTTSPFQNTKQISSNKHVAYAIVDTKISNEKLANSINQIKNILEPSNKISILIGGTPAYIADVNHLSETNLVRGELIALPICFIIMIFIFGGILAAFITILCGVISIIIITTLLYILGYYIDLSVYVLNIASMLGLGLCLDYSLLITYRFREEWACYSQCKPTIRVTLANSGKAIVFSGLIFLISIGSLMFFPINVLHSIGIAGVIIVIVTMSCCLTFLPSMLCLFEKYITHKPTVLEGDLEDKPNLWYRLVEFVMSYPTFFFLATISILIFLGHPFLYVKLNNSNAKILPTWSESRKVVDVFEKYFNSNALEPITIMLIAKNSSILSKENIAALYDFAQTLKNDPRVKSVNSIVSIKPDLDKKQYQQLYQRSKLPFNNYENQLFHSITKDKYTIMNVVSRHSKDDNRNFELVNDIRKSHVKHGINKLVTGYSAHTIDAIKSSYSLFFKTCIFISIVTYILLVLLLRSIILPLKAIIMNILSLSVCYGMLVYIFQEGHFATLLGFQPAGFTDLNLPIMIFFILFGLSMDYEVFLLTRIHEYYTKTKDNEKSVALGIEKSIRIITSAALILVVVSGAFVTADLIFIKSFGLGTALAIIVDTTIIRLLLVPATMHLLGDWNWYLPRWLDKLLPHIKLEEEPSCKIVTDPNGKVKDA